MIDKKTGTVIGTKPRGEINKREDPYHAVYVIVITPDGKVVLGEIPERDDLENLYVGTLGVTAATILRDDETPEAAARRALKDEVYIDEAQIHESELVWICEGLHVLSDGAEKYFTLYTIVTRPMRGYSKRDTVRLVLYPIAELERLMAGQPERFAPTLLCCWQQYVSPS